VRLVVGGCVGPSDDAYAPSKQISADAACAYHRPQIETFAQTPADFLNALASLYPELRERLPNLRVAGGCCGTGERHIAASCAALT
jgi:S-methylmethionine-dependent homocysteine/selenocysteine methylase